VFAQEAAMAARLTVVFDDETLYRKLKVRAAEEGVSMKQIIESALNAYLEHREGERPRRLFDWDAFEEFQRHIEEMDGENPDVGPTDLSDIKHHLYGYPKRPFDEQAWLKLAEEPTPYDAR
jgi:plasmid stability protein